MTLIVSFWDVCLDNLPLGNITHEILTPQAAKALIDGARESKTLVGIVGDDLFAPYHHHRLKNHEELCQVLRQTHDIDLSLADFTMDDFGEDGERMTFLNPLNIYSIGPDAKMMVITNTYEFAKNFADANELDASHYSFGLIVASDSVEFHIFSLT